MVERPGLENLGVSNRHASSNLASSAKTSRFRKTRSPPVASFNPVALRLQRIANSKNIACNAENRSNCAKMKALWF